MEKAYEVFSTLSESVTAVLFIAVFYLSIRKCFVKENGKKIRLILMILLTHPYIAFCYVTYIIGGAIYIINIDDPDINTRFDMGTAESVPFLISVMVVLWLLELFYAWLVGRRLKVRHPSLVFFVYLMFHVYFMLSVRGLDHNLFRDSVFLMLMIKITEFILDILWMCLFYSLIIKTLAGLGDRPFNTSWRIFIIPPALFSLLYGTAMLSLYFFLDGTTTLTIYIFSTLISFLFIWAFYVIIRNISATGDALEAKDKVKTLSVEVMEALAHTIDAKDEYTKGHSVRVAKYSRMLAERLGLSQEECENIYYMGLLHDIGKIGVPNEIINSRTRLTDEEYNVIKTHPGTGYDILTEIKSRPDLAIGARWHHERFDGNGYPDGKAGEDIPLPARIISVADSYDAMTSNRSYRSYLPQERVRKELMQNSGTQFDPMIAEVMCKIMDDDKEYTLREET